MLFTPIDRHAPKRLRAILTPSLLQVCVYHCALGHDILDFASFTIHKRQPRIADELAQRVDDLLNGNVSVHHKQRYHSQWGRGKAV